MNISLDVDGVLADFGTHFLNYLNIEDKSPAKEWDDPRFKNNFHKIQDDELFWLSIPRLIDPKLIKFPITAYVTARPIEWNVTKIWLEMNGFPDAPVFSVGLDNSKVDTLKELNIDLFVDDAIHNFKEINDAGINCYLMSRSHNEGFDAKGKRIESLEQINKII